MRLPQDRTRVDAPILYIGYAWLADRDVYGLYLYCRRGLRRGGLHEAD